MNWLLNFVCAVAVGLFLLCLFMLWKSGDMHWGFLAVINSIAVFINLFSIRILKMIGGA